MEFKDRLKLIREAKHITQTELANLVGIAPNTLNSYENTNREPRISLVMKLAKALNVSTDELLGVTDNNSFFYKRFLLPPTYQVNKTINNDYIINMYCEKGVFEIEINKDAFENEMLHKFTEFAKTTDDIYYSYVENTLLTFVLSEISKSKRAKELLSSIRPTTASDKKPTDQ